MEFSESWHLPGCDSETPQMIRWSALFKQIGVAEGFPLKALNGWRPVRSGASG